MALHLSDYFGCHIREVIDIFKSEQKDCGFSTYIQALKEKKILKVTLPGHSSQYYYLMPSIESSKQTLMFYYNGLWSESCFIGLQKMIDVMNKGEAKIDIVSD